MSAVKNDSIDDLIVPVLGHRLVKAGEEVEVAPELVLSFTHPGAPSPVWSPADDEAQAIHDEAVAAAEADVIPAELLDRLKNELDTGTIDQLRALAAEANIDLTGVSLKADIVTVIADAVAGFNKERTA